MHFKNDLKAEEMAQSVTCLLYKNEKLSAIIRTYTKTNPDVVACLCNPRTGRGKWADPWACWPAGIQVKVDGT